MKVTGLRLYRYALPLDPPPEIAGRPLHHREGVLIELTGDGVEGWGEASPLPGFSRETPEEVARQLLDLGPSLAGLDLSNWPESGFLRALDRSGLTPSARFGMELAAANLYAASRAETLPEALGPRPGTEVGVNGLLTGSGKDVLGEARRMRSAGYAAVKLKVGRGSVGDAALVRAVSGALGGYVGLRLDANRAWSFGEALEFVRATEGCRYEYIEEPLADPSRLPRFVDDTGAPVALDESLTGMGPEALGGHRYARAVVLKPTLLGGLSHALRMAERARSLGIVPVVSSAFETGVGTLGLVALAACTGGEAPAGLDTYRRLAADVLRPRPELSARIRVPEMMGVRRTVDRSLLEEVRSSGRALRSCYE